MFLLMFFLPSIACGFHDNHALKSNQPHDNRQDAAGKMEEEPDSFGMSPHLVNMMGNLQNSNFPLNRLDPHMKRVAINSSLPIIMSNRKQLTPMNMFPSIFDDLFSRSVMDTMQDDATFEDRFSFLPFDFLGEISEPIKPAKVTQSKTGVDQKSSVTSSKPTNKADTKRGRKKRCNTSLRHPIIKDVSPEIVRDKPSSLNCSRTVLGFNSSANQTDEMPIRIHAIHITSYRDVPPSILWFRLGFGQNRNDAESNISSTETNGTKLSALCRPSNQESLVFAIIAIVVLITSYIVLHKIGCESQRKDSIIRI